MNLAVGVNDADIGKGTADVDTNSKRYRRRQTILHALFIFDVSDTKYRMSGDCEI